MKTKYFDSNGKKIEYGDIIKFKGKGEFGIVVENEDVEAYPVECYRLFWAKNYQFGGNMFPLKCLENKKKKRHLTRHVIGNVFNAYSNYLIMENIDEICKKNDIK